MNLIKHLLMTRSETGQIKWTVVNWLQWLDDFFLFIKLIELEGEKILNINFLITCSGQDILDQLCSKIKNNELLQRDWDLLTKDLNNRLLCDRLFHRIVTKWFNIRINAFVKTWLKIINNRMRKWRDEQTRSSGWSLIT